MILSALTGSLAWGTGSSRCPWKRATGLPWLGKARLAFHRSVQYL